MFRYPEPSREVCKKQGDAPSLESGGAAIHGDRMTRSSKGNRNINATADEGTEGKRIRHKKVKRNDNEMYANNNAKQAAVNDLMSPVGMLNFWIRDYKDELAKMNEGKVGRPYEYTNSLIYWALLVKSLLNTDYQTAEGVIKSKIEWVKMTDYAKFLPDGFRSPDFTTLFRRTEKLVESISSTYLSEDPRVMCAFCMREVTTRVRACAVDSTALNLSNTNLWRKTKWKEGPVYRGWIKIHALVDTDTDEIVAAIVTTDKMGDNTAFEMLTEIAFGRGHLISTIYADSAYESKDNWLDSEKRKYTLVVKFKCNCNGKCNGSFARGIAAKEYLSMSYEEWRATTKYGRRWKSECTFSDFKRLISEHIDAVTDAGIITETIGKIEAFNYYKGVRSRMIGVTCNGVAIG